MRIIRRFLNIFLLTVLFSLNACNVLKTPAVNTPAPGLAKTIAAQTLSADARIAELRLSQTPAPTEPELPTATGTPTHIAPPTATSFPTVPTELFTSGEVISNTLQATIDPDTYPTPDFSVKLSDGSPAPCNAAKFIADITIPDGMRISTREKFTKIWRIQNIGACSWNPGYALVLTWGNAFGVQPPVWFDRITKPGETYDIILGMEAPYIPACWQGNWMLQDPEGLRFGVGYEFANALHVRISVYVRGLPFHWDPCNSE